jgi:tRNA pseudouridine55 synthase
MLPICLGEACKTAGFMLDAAKTYVAEAVLGRSTTTGDIEGELLREAPVPELTTAAIESAMARFTGPIEQVPPMYSALKHRGQRLYELAREGREVPRKPRPVTIHELRLLSWRAGILEFRVHCSKGTYIRTLAEDLAASLGTCAHLRALRRLRVEPFAEQDMLTFGEAEQLAEDGTLDAHLRAPDAGLRAWPRVELDAAGAAAFSHGNPVDCDTMETGPARVYGPGDRLLGLGEVSCDGRLKARRVFNLPC